MKNHTPIALDSNIFIYSFEKHPQFSPLTRKIFDNLEKNNFTAVTSIISLTETLSYPMPEEKVKILTDLFSEVPNLTIYDINQIIALEAARIKRIYRFRLPDSLQLATALYAKSNSFITNDQRLKSFRETKVVMLSDLSESHAKI